MICVDKQELLECYHQVATMCAHKLIRYLLPMVGWLDVSELSEETKKHATKRVMQVSKEIRDDISKIMWGNVSRENPDESFPWEDQMQVASVKDACAIRWHSLVVKGCFYLQQKSSGAYELLRESGIIKLPLQRMLKDYTHHIRAAPGFSPKVDHQLMESAEITTCPGFTKYVFLLMDEIHVKENLVYEKHTGMFVVRNE